MTKHHWGFIGALIVGTVNLTVGIFLDEPVNYVFASVAYAWAPMTVLLSQVRRLEHLLIVTLARPDTEVAKAIREFAMRGESDDR